MSGVDSVALEDCVGDWLGGIEIMRGDACSRVSCAAGNELPPSGREIKFRGSRTPAPRLPRRTSADTNAPYGRKTQKTAKPEGAPAARTGRSRAQRDQGHAADGGKNPRRLRALRL